MKRVAILGADFAPSSLPPALRIRFFARHLPEFGWQPTIVTTQPGFYDCAVDAENERLIPESLEVIRTRALSAKLTRKLGVGDIGMRSLWHHWRAMANLCRRKLVDLVFIPVPPCVPMVLGRLIHARFGVPYVVDYIDPWITEYYWKLPRQQRPPKWPMAYAMARTLEPFALRRAGGIVGVSQGTVDGVVSRYPWLRHTGTCEIPYGGEPSDFDYLRANPRQHSVFDKSDGLLHVSYVGACIQPMFSTVRALFKGVRAGLDESPRLFERLRLHFVGSSYTDRSNEVRPLVAMAREAGIEQFVTEQRTRIPYLDALQVLLDSHALVAVGSEEPHYTASKIFPYILAKRPLLGVFHRDSSVNTILTETEAGFLVTFSESQPVATQVPNISKHLRTILQLPHNYCPPTCWQNFDKYTTRSAAMKLAGVFDSALADSARY